MQKVTDQKDINSKNDKKGNKETLKRKTDLNIDDRRTLTINAEYKAQVQR